MASSSPNKKYPVKRSNLSFNLEHQIRRRKMKKIESRKIGFIGDWGVGKDSLVLKLLGMDIPDPKVEEDRTPYRNRCSTEIQNWERDKHFDLTMRIIPSTSCRRQKEERSLRFLRHEYELSAIVFCFALNCSSSLFSLKYNWIPMARFYLRRMPLFIIVGTKSDLPEDPSIEEEALRLLESEKAGDYIKCSARNNINIVNVRNMVFNMLTYSLST